MDFLKKTAVRSRWLYRDGLFRLGFGGDLLRNRTGASILVYHGLDSQGRKDLNGRFISAGEFETQLRYFKKHFQLLTLDDFFFEKFHPEKYNLCLTFDDGYRNHLTLALPILEKYEAPAAFFLTGVAATEYPMLWPDFLDIAMRLREKPVEIEGTLFRKKGREFHHPNGLSLKQFAKKKPWQFKLDMVAAFGGWEQVTRLHDLAEYWEQLSPAEIQRLAQSPWVTIGSHGYLHNNLGEIDLPAATEEMRLSKSILEKISGRPVKAIAFPDGSYSPAVIGEAGRLGYRRLLAVDLQKPEDAALPQLRGRMNTSPFLSLKNQIAAIFEGHY